MTMNRIYTAIGTSKQAFHQKLARWMGLQERSLSVQKIVEQVRKDHPRMSVRTIWAMTKPKGMGRDQFEALAHQKGYQIERKRNFMKTTNSLGVTRFPNRIEAIELTHVNQVWVSDITYYRLSDVFVYITLIMDLYSRYLVGYSLSKDLQTTNTTIPALQRALLVRDISYYHEWLILHSDGGGQFYSKALLRLTRQHGLLNSMAYEVYENAHAERLIGTIKNDYLIPNGPENFHQLNLLLPKVCRLYNQDRPHQSLNMTSPLEFECMRQKVFHFSTVTNKEKEAKRNW